jgi:hypothetical protein
MGLHKTARSLIDGLAPPESAAAGLSHPEPAASTGPAGGRSATHVPSSSADARGWPRTHDLVASDTHTENKLTRSTAKIAKERGARYAH